MEKLIVHKDSKRTTKLRAEVASALQYLNANELSVLEKMSLEMLTPLIADLKGLSRRLGTKFEKPDYTPNSKKDLRREVTDSLDYFNHRQLKTLYAMVNLIFEPKLEKLRPLLRNTSSSYSNSNSGQRKPQYREMPADELRAIVLELKESGYTHEEVHQDERLFGINPRSIGRYLEHHTIGTYKKRIDKGEILFSGQKRK